MQAKRNADVPKYFLGGLLASGGVDAALGLGRAIFGASQRKRARKEMERLKNDPRRMVHVPAAIRERANAPIAETFMRQMEENAARRTAQGVDALGRAGSRGIIGGLGSLVDQERGAERERMANYEQERRSALAELGRAEERVQDDNLQMWKDDLRGAQGELGAGQQNIFGGLTGVGRGASYLANAGLFDKGTRGANETVANIPSRGIPNVADYGEPLPIRDPNRRWPNVQPDYGTPRGPIDNRGVITQLPPYEDGGKLPGAFDHDKNPIHLITDDGKKVGEATGGETILNPEQTKKIEAMAKSKDKRLASYIASLFKSFKK